ncbi:hypothetical protein AB0D38_47450, partial [Streptomyces sp. NPDC048279]
EVQAHLPTLVDEVAEAPAYLPELIAAKAERELGRTLSWAASAARCFATSSSKVCATSRTLGMVVAPRLPRRPGTRPGALSPPAGPAGRDPPTPVCRR